LQSGEVKTGDNMILIESNPESLCVSEIFSIFRLNRANLNLIKKALAEEFIAESCRKDIQKILDFNES
jgi:MOSC domain-containing protein YiiM